MLFSFLDIRPIDVIDIVLSAYLMYAIYKLIKHRHQHIGISDILGGCARFEYEHAVGGDG